MIKWRYLKKFWNFVPLFVKNLLPRALINDVLRAVSREYFITQKFVSSYPLVSGDTFKSVCDLHFEFNTDSNVILAALDKWPRNEVVKIYLEPGSNYVELFSKISKSDTSVRMCFIYSNGDNSLTDHEIEKLESKAKFFSINSKSKVIYNIPLGIDNLRECRYGNIINYTNSDVTYFDSKTPKTIMVLINFREETNLKYRLDAKLIAQNYDFVSVRNRVDFETNIENLKSSYFVLSPAGNGIDCFRNYEAMYLGSVPVVQENDYLPFMKDLPILKVGNFQEFLSLTETNKIEIYNRFKGKTYPKLHFKYWQKYIDDSVT